jgi:hypothetical protein
MAIQKDYKAIAEIIRQEYTRFNRAIEMGEHQTVTNIALNIANYFEGANPWFNKTQFLMACEFEE